MKKNSMATVMNFNDQITNFFSLKEKLEPNEAFCRSITIQVTEDCNLACTYCYETHKSKKMMTTETGYAIIDLLFKMWDDNNSSFINQKTKGLIIDFIGGEPFLNIEVIDNICEYFINKSLERHHPWLLYTKFQISSNGILYFDPKVQNFIQKYKNFISLNISIDGPEEIHNACRIFPSGEGSFKQANRADLDYLSFSPQKASISTKATISPENLKNLNKIIEYFITNGKKHIFANTVYEAEWNIEQAQLFYQELKIMADILLSKNDPEIYISLFDENFFTPYEEDDLKCWCGGAGKMLAFDPDGIAYPCLRYMPSSLGDIPPVIIGDINGIYQNKDTLKLKNFLESINRRTKNDDECFYCSIASGCADCEAWNYQSANGQFNIKSKNICWMHRARALTNYYYWNKYYQQNNINKKKKIFIEKDIALQIISQEEWNMLNSLVK